MKTRHLIPVLLLQILPLFTVAQSIRAYLSVSETNIPDLKWYDLKGRPESSFIVYRSPAGKGEFAAIGAWKSVFTRNDTLFYEVRDTTLKVQGLYEYYIGFPITTGNERRSEIMYGHNMGNVPPPQVVSFTATPVPGRKALRLDWKLNYSFTVRALVLYRSRRSSDGFQPVATLPPGSESYTDDVTVANEPWFYFLQVQDYFGYQLPSAVIHGIATWGTPGIPPQAFMAAALSGTVVLSWMGAGDNPAGYRIFRQAGEDPNFRQLGEMIPAGMETTSFTDTALNLPGIIEARYYAVAVSDAYLESRPTDTLTVALSWNIRVLPPRELNCLQDTTGGIRLIWSLEGLSPDVLGFNIYRTANDGTPVKITSSPVPYPLNSWTDEHPGAYGIISYAVESVSIAGLPSVMRAVSETDLPQPAFHLVLATEIKGTSVELSWANPSLPDLDAFYFYRKTGDNPARMISMVSATATSWTDADLVPGNSYIYTMVAEFRDGKRLLVNDGVLVRIY